MLKLDHLGDDVIKQRLPGIREIALKFAHVDPAKAPIPVVPTAHYMMGGIPTNFHGQVVAPYKTGPDEAVHGLYAVGECACVSVHGANRLGCNSLLDLMVFGREAGRQIIEDLKNNPHTKPLPADAAERPLARLARLENQKNGERVPDVGDAMRRTMQKPLRGVPLSGFAGRRCGADQAGRRTGCQHRDPGQEQSLQYRAHRGAGAG